MTDRISGLYFGGAWFGRGAAGGARPGSSGVVLGVVAARAHHRRSRRHARPVVVRAARTVAAERLPRHQRGSAPGSSWSRRPALRRSPTRHRPGAADRRRPSRGPSCCSTTRTTSGVSAASCRAAPATTSTCAGPRHVVRRTATATCTGRPTPSPTSGTSRRSAATARAAAATRSPKARRPGRRQPPVGSATLRRRAQCGTVQGPGDRVEGVAPGYRDAMHGLCIACHRAWEAEQAVESPASAAAPPATVGWFQRTVRQRWKGRCSRRNGEAMTRRPDRQVPVIAVIDDEEDIITFLCDRAGGRGVRRGGDQRAERRAWSSWRARSRT